MPNVAPSKVPIVLALGLMLEEAPDEPFEALAMEFFLTRAEAALKPLVLSLLEPLGLLGGVVVR